MKNVLLTLSLVLLAIVPGVCQIVTTQPDPVQMSSTDIVLTYNAASPLGNRGLSGLASSVDVYAHIGLITNKSADNSDWKYVVAPWPNTGNQQAANLDKNRLTYVSANTYTLTIPNIRSYFGMTNPEEYATKIAIVFRNADGTKSGKTSSGGDIFIDVVNDGFAIELTSDHPDRVIDGTTTITYTVAATHEADLNLSVNDVVFASQTATKKLTASYTFTETGNYIVKASSKYDGHTYTQTMEVSYPAAGLAQDYPGGVPRMGAVRSDDGKVTFCIAAPGKTSVQLVGSWNDYVIDDKYLAKYQDYQGNRYFWTTVEGLARDVYYPYYFIVDDKYKVGDPYANLVLDPYNDKTLRASVWRDVPKFPYDKFPAANFMMGCYRGDIDDYTFSDFTIPEHDNLVIYELLLRDFTGIDGQANGWGSLAKAKDKIPYIKEMGFNAIELMPIMEFSGNNSWGYNTNFYMAPDKSYGSPKDYKDFIEACHQAGIAVILDIVFNQSDGLHPWYQMYPIDTNPFYNKVAPHSWSVLNDWNQDNALVQQQWTDALKYWMEKYNVDGFRFDLVKGLGDNNSYSAGTEAYNQSRVDRMIRLHGVIKSVKPNGIHINEDLAGSQEETALGNDGQLCWANVNNASCQFAMGYDTGDNNLMRFLSSRDSRPWGSTVSYAESHDEQRMGFKAVSFGNGDVMTDDKVRYDRLGGIAVQMLMTPGPKMVWMFGELGNDQNAKKNADGGGDNNTDPKIVNWKWLEDPNKAYLKDTYGAVINLRMANPDLFGRDATFEVSGLAGKFTRGRYMRLLKDGKEAIAFINPSVSETFTISCPASVISATNKVLVRASEGTTPTLTGSGTVSVTLAPNQYAIFASTSVAAVEDVVATPDADAPVQYFNLQGVAVASDHLAPGLYIRRQGSIATKVLIR